MAEKKQDEAQLDKAAKQGTATGAKGVLGEEGNLDVSVPGGPLPEENFDESNRTDTDRAVNPSPNVGAVLNPHINAATDDERGKPVYIPPPGSQNRELRKNLEKHAAALGNVFEDQDDKKDSDKK